MTTSEEATKAEIAANQPVEDYIAGIQWSDRATEWEKTLVAGNLRAYHAHLLRRQAAP